MLNPAQLQAIISQYGGNKTPTTTPATAQNQASGTSLPANGSKVSLPYNMVGPLAPGETRAPKPAPSYFDAPSADTSGRATGTPVNINVPASHQGAVDFINSGKAPAPSIPTNTPAPKSGGNWWDNSIVGSGKATGTPAGVSVPASHQGAVDFINNGAAPGAKPPIQGVGKNFLNNISKIGEGFVDTLGGAGAGDLKSAVDPNTPMPKAIADFLLGLGKSAYSDAMFIPKGVYDFAKSMAQEVGAPGSSDYSKQIADAQNETGKPSDPNSMAKGFLTGAQNILPFVGLDEAVKSLPGKFDPLKQNPTEVAAKTVGKVTTAAGQIAQGTTEDIPKMARTITQIDIPKDPTFQNLVDSTTAKIEANSKIIDNALATNPTTTPLTSLDIKVGGATHNFVTDAFSQLKELYQKTNDPAGLKAITDLETKAKTQGLTTKEINDLSREYGNEFKQKGYNKKGDALTSVNAQAVQNTQSGLKTTARSLFGDETLKQADSGLSDLIRSRDLLEERAKAVQDATQKIPTTSWYRTIMQKGGTGAAHLVDILSGGGIGKFGRTLLGYGKEGAKTMDAIALEKALPGNIATIKKLSDPNTTPAQAIQILDQMAKDNAADTTPLPTPKAPPVNVKPPTKINVVPKDPGGSMEIPKSKVAPKNKPVPKAIPKNKK